MVFEKMLVFFFCLVGWEVGIVVLEKCGKGNM